jgi:hypothetical protein
VDSLFLICTIILIALVCYSCYLHGWLACAKEHDPLIRQLQEALRKKQEADRG